MNFYKDNIKNTNNKLDELNGKNGLFYTSRLISFALIIVCLFFANSYAPIIILGSVVSLIVFIIIGMRHNKHENKLKNLRNKITILKNYEYRINNQFHTFPNKGSMYLEEENFYLSDLDIFGDSSLFQLINVAETRMGQDKLANRLKCTSDKYLSDVYCVEELKDSMDFSIDFQANNYNYSKDSTKVTLETSLDLLSKKPKLNILEIIIPILIVVGAISTLVYSIISSNILFFAVDIIINYVISLIYGIVKKQQFDSIKDIVRSLSPLSTNFKLVSDTKFKTEKLQNIKTNISSGYDSMLNLQKIETLVGLQENFLSSFVVNVLMPFNFMITILYSKFHKKSNVNLEKAIEDYTNLESLLSLAIIPQIKEVTCIPTLNNNISINFEDIKHPLIKEEVCVENTLSVKPSVNIITGSNMSGKTSFLRTIGVNLVLMYSGGMTHAKSFDSDTINIYSSMRITDDIKNGISTFYRELLRIKSAIRDAHNDTKSIILVDEVFRGTNSNDRITGAIALINQLKLPNVILFMTTHDFELCKVDNVDNFHFEEHYKDDKIGFDYKLKTGQCTTTNAVYLMKLAGIMN